MSRQARLAEREIRNNPGIRANVMECLEDAVSPLVRVSSRYNAIYGIRDFNRGMMRAAGSDASVGGCASGRLTGRDILGAGGGTSPSDEWHRTRLAAVDADAVHAMLSETVSDQLRRLGALGKLPADGLVVAVDMHLIPRYDRTRGEELTRSRYKNGTKYFERYVTIQCVNDGARLHLGCLPVPALESVPRMVRALMERCMADGIRIKMCLFDREFFSAENISNLNELGINYLMPCRNTHGVVESLRRFAADPRRDTLPCTLAGSGETAPYNMVVVERRSRDSKKAPTAPENRFIGFATNMPWVDVIIYAVRWGIESGYAKVEAMRAKTRSRRLGARLFCFIYSLIIFNMWVMARALLSASGLPLARRKRTLTQLAFTYVFVARTWTGYLVFCYPPIAVS